MALTRAGARALGSPIMRLVRTVAAAAVLFAVLDGCDLSSSPAADDLVPVYSGPYANGYGSPYGYGLTEFDWLPVGPRPRVVHVVHHVTQHRTVVHHVTPPRRRAPAPAAPRPVRGRPRGR